MISRSRDGFTLIEMMIAIAILGVWCVSIPPLLPHAFKASAVALTRNQPVEQILRLEWHLRHDLQTGRIFSLAFPGQKPPGGGLVYVVKASGVQRIDGAASIEFPGIRISTDGPARAFILESTGPRPFATVFSLPPGGAL